VQDIPAGGRLTAENVRSIRPGYGLPPKHLPEVLGRQGRPRHFAGHAAGLVPDRAGLSVYAASVKAQVISDRSRRRNRARACA